MFVSRKRHDRMVNAAKQALDLNDKYKAAAESAYNRGYRDGVLEEKRQAEKREFKARVEEALLDLAKSGQWDRVLRVHGIKRQAQD